MKFDLEFLANLYRMFGRETVKRMLTVPGGPLIKKAEANRDDPAEISAKRDIWVEATMDLVEEYANLDND
jgi:hypothetical protein